MPIQKKQRSYETMSEPERKYIDMLVDLIQYKAADVIRMNGGNDIVFVPEEKEEKEGGVNNG